jgi:hypothetical protein
VGQLLEMGLSCVHEATHLVCIKHVHNDIVANSFWGDEFLRQTALLKWKTKSIAELNVCKSSQRQLRQHLVKAAVAEQLRAVVVKEVVAEVESRTLEDNTTTSRTLNTTLGPSYLLLSLISTDLPTSSLEMAVVEVVVPALVLFADHQGIKQGNALRNAHPCFFPSGIFKSASTHRSVITSGVLKEPCFSKMVDAPVT